MAVIRALIVDDEPHARETLRLRLSAEPGFEIVGEARSGGEALRAITGLRPDLVFLDVRMPDLSGFEVLDALETDELPFVVFVTAHDEYALAAFRVHALAYLLKPFDDLRFGEVMQHVRRFFAGPGGDVRAHLAQLLAELREAAPERGRPLERLVVKLGGRTWFVAAEEVDWIEAEGDYARLHCGGATHLVSKTITELAAVLDSRRFARIHRSTIVNIGRIRELHTEDHRDFTVTLDDGTLLRLSRTYRRALEAAVGDRI
ncbi:MAG TPA: LytTR family DNA-binding domain-containing protein [Longimicrobium sp.]|nr:LytTR family DNA-binding domain-containing protein [Longimicrobium sp.]